MGVAFGRGKLFFFAYCSWDELIDIDRIGHSCL